MVSSLADIRSSRRGADAILACIAVAHAVTLLLMPAADSYAGRWLDVMVPPSPPR